MFRITTTALAIAAVALAGCSQAEAVDISTADVVVVADDMTYVDPPATVPAGSISLAIDNRGNATHDLTFEGGAGTVVSARGGRADVAEVDLEPGTYTVYCSVSGHRQAGMAFDVTVE